MQGIKEQLQHPLASLQLHPEDLPRYLTEDLQFRLVRQLSTPDTAHGFDRPMYLFQKIC